MGRRLCGGETHLARSVIEAGEVRVLPNVGPGEQGPLEATRRPVVDRP